MTTDNRATTLKQAYRVCDLVPLTGDAINKYYVDLSSVRNTKAINNIDQCLSFQDPEEFTTMLFTGHRGCGKSTELRQIQRKWEQEYFIIYIEADQEVDIDDARYTDLYLVIIKQVEYALRKVGIKFDQDLLNNFENWFKEVTEESEESVEKSVSMSGTLEVNSSPLPVPFIAKLLVKLLAQIKGSNRQKTTIRQTLEQDISRLQSDINLLLQNGLKKLRQKFPDYKGILVIVDNLDRVPPHVGEHLFFDYAPQLQNLCCNIIYTVPIAIVYSAKKVSNFFDDVNIVPMVNVYNLVRETADLDYKEEVLKAITSIIERRVDVDTIFENKDDLLRLAKASGGHVRQLMQMMRKSITNSVKSNKITSDAVTIAIKDIQFDFERIIPDNHYSTLVNVYLNKEVTNNEIGQLILSNTSALEYNGTERWNYINPVVKSIATFQKLLKEEGGLLV